MSWPLGWADTAIAGCTVLVGAAIVVIDARSHRIPNRLTGSWTLIVAGISLASAIASGQSSAALRAAGTGLAMFAVGYLLAMISPDAFGFGDVKLLGCIGLALGHLDPQLLTVWLIGLAVATLGWLLLAPWVDRQYDRRTPLLKRHIAFGPPIVIALWVTYVVVVAAS